MSKHFRVPARKIAKMQEAGIRVPDVLRSAGLPHTARDLWCWAAGDLASRRPAGSPRPIPGLSLVLVLKAACFQVLRTAGWAGESAGACAERAGTDSPLTPALCPLKAEGENRDNGSRRESSPDCVFCWSNQS